MWLYKNFLFLKKGYGGVRIFREPPKPPNLSEDLKKFPPFLRGARGGSKLSEGILGDFCVRRS